MSASYFGHILGQYLDLNYIFDTAGRKGSTMCHFAAGGLGIKYESAVCRSSLLKGDALPLSIGPAAQCAENTQGVREPAAVHRSQALACSLSQPYRPKYCITVSEFKERLRAFVDLVPIPDT